MMFLLVIVLVGAVSFGSGIAFERSRKEDDTALEVPELPARVGRPEYLGFHVPPSRFAGGHPPEQPPTTPAP